MPYINKEDLPVGSFNMGDAAFETNLVYGNNFSVMFATRPPGYHSKPHTHPCEQFNIVIEGESISFCNDSGHRNRPGDINRIPAGALHWAWNKSDKPYTIIEIHSPGLQNDPKTAEYAYPLFAEGEEINLLGSPVNDFPPLEEVREIMEKAEAPFVNNPDL